MENRISKDQFVKIYKVEVTFLDSLEESGLIHPIIENNVEYITFEELPQIEKYANWHYDLEVNLPGIEVIHNLLEKINDLERERNHLLHQIRFENHDWEDL